MNNALEMMWKKPDMSLFKALAWNLPEVANLIQDSKCPFRDSNRGYFRIQVKSGPL
jgi:hypothetical protein